MGNKCAQAHSQTPGAKSSVDIVPTPTNRRRSSPCSRQPRQKALGLGFVPFGGAPLENLVDLVETMNVLGGDVAVAVELIKFLPHFQLAARLGILVGRIKLADAGGCDRIQKVVVRAHLFVIDQRQREHPFAGVKNVTLDWRKSETIVIQLGFELE